MASLRSQLAHASSEIDAAHLEIAERKQEPQATNVDKTPESAELHLRIVVGDGGDGCAMIKRHLPPMLIATVAAAAGALGAPFFWRVHETPSHLAWVAFLGFWVSLATMSVPFITRLVGAHAAARCMHLVPIAIFLIAVVNNSWLPRDELLQRQDEIDHQSLQLALACAFFGAALGAQPDNYSSKRLKLCSLSGICALQVVSGAILAARTGDTASIKKRVTFIGGPFLLAYVVSFSYQQHFARSANKDPAGA